MWLHSIKDMDKELIMMVWVNSVLMFIIALGLGVRDLHRMKLLWKVIVAPAAILALLALINFHILLGVAFMIHVYSPAIIMGTTLILGLAYMQKAIRTRDKASVAIVVLCALSFILMLYGRLETGTFATMNLRDM